MGTCVVSVCGQAEHRSRTESIPASPSTATGPWWHWGTSRRATCPAIIPQSPVVTPVPLPAVGALQVSQEPAKLRVAAGTNVSLWCQLVTTEPWSLARISWLKDGDHEVLCTTRLYPKAAAVPCATPRLHLAWSPPYANLSLHGAQEGDAGSYVCCFAIEKPYLAMAAGNGTLLNVSTGADGVHGAEQKWKLWGAVGGTLLLVGLISFGCWRCRRRTDTSDIYVNVTLRRTPRNKSPQGAAAGGQRVQGGLGRAWKPPSPKG